MYRGGVQAVAALAGTVALLLATMTSASAAAVNRVSAFQLPAQPAPTPYAGVPTGGAAMTDTDVFIGSPAEETVYVYARPASGGVATTPAAELMLPGHPDEGLGEAVFASGQTVVVPGRLDTAEPDPKLYVFTEPAGGWSGTITPSATLSDPKGLSLGGPSNVIAVDGSTIAAFVDPPPGATDIFSSRADVFTEPAAGWKGNLRPSGVLALPKDAFGPLSISGRTIAEAGLVHGDVVAGSAVMFREPAHGWSGTVKPFATLGIGCYDGTPGGNEVPIFVARKGPFSSHMRVSACLATSQSLSLYGATNTGTMFVLAGSTSTKPPFPGVAVIFTAPAHGWSGVITSHTAVPFQGDSQGDFGEAVDGNQLLVGPAGVVPAALAPGPWAYGLFTVTAPVSETVAPLTEASTSP